MNAFASGRPDDRDELGAADLEAQPVERERAVEAYGDVLDDDLRPAPVHGFIFAQAGDTRGVDEDDRPPICATCGVTMVPAALSARENPADDWVCLECEELDDEA